MTITHKNLVMKAHPEICSLSKRWLKAQRGTAYQAWLNCHHGTWMAYLVQNLTSYRGRLYQNVESAWGKAKPGWDGRVYAPWSQDGVDRKVDRAYADAIRAAVPWAKVKVLLGLK